jgi:hypothetical protein
VNFFFHTNFRGVGPCLKVDILQLEIRGVNVALQIVFQWVSYALWCVISTYIMHICWDISTQTSQKMRFLTYIFLGFWSFLEVNILKFKFWCANIALYIVSQWVSHALWCVIGTYIMHIFWVLSTQTSQKMRFLTSEKKFLSPKKKTWIDSDKNENINQLFFLNFFFKIFKIFKFLQPTHNQV